MGKTIEITFNVTPEVIDDNALILGLEDSDGNGFSLPLVFKDVPNFSLNVQIPNPYNNNTIASNYRDKFEENYTLVNPGNPSLNEFIATVNLNVVTIFTNNDTTFDLASGSAISSGAITTNIVADVGALSIDSYTTDVGNECTNVDVNLTITGGTGPYDIYVDDVLNNSAVTSPFALNLPRGASKEIKAIDSLSALIGIVNTNNTTSLNDVDIEVNFNFIDKVSEFTVVILPNFISDIVSPYTYSDDGITYTIDRIFTNVPSGLNTFYIKDSLGCVTTKVVSLGLSLVYFTEFRDVENILHRVNISKQNYTETPIEFNGSCVLSYPEDRDVQAPIKPSELKINLLATEGINFSDLYQEEEQVFQVQYIRDSQVLFNGWLSSDGLFESYVADKWYLELTAIDGLGYLKDLSYLDEETGEKYTGKQSGLEIIVNALKRTGIRQDIRETIGIIYTPFFAFGLTTLSATFYDTRSFIKDDDSTVKSCEEVLESILNIFNASLNSFNGVWYIYRSNDFADIITSNYNFNSYTFDGTPNGGVDNLVSVPITTDLGSQIDGFYPHHVNSNQQKSLMRSLGAYRLNLKYGNFLPYFRNTDLVWTDASNITDWTINEPSYITNYDGTLTKFEVTNVPSGGLTKVATSDEYTQPFSTISPPFFLPFNRRLEVTFNLSNDDEINTNTFFAKVKGFIPGVGFEYLNNSGSWIASATLEYEIPAGEQNVLFNVISNGTNIYETITIEIYSTDALGTNVYVINEIIIKTYKEADFPIGENYTIEKLVNFTPSVNNSVLEVFNGDVLYTNLESSIYKGNINNEVTNTWNRSGFIENKELLRINVEDRMRMNYRPRLIFEGDTYGYIPFMTILNINNVKDKMLPYSYSYDALNNVTNIKSVEIINNEFNEADVSFSKVSDFGNVVKPTIKG